MVLVLLGTQNNDFHRLLDEIDKNIENGIIKDEVIVQSGFTKYYSKNMKIFNLVPKQELENLVDKADLIITHAGVGSIEMSLEKNKKVIAVARKKEFGEHVNNHQKEIQKEFSKKGFLIGIENVENLGQAIEKSKNFVPIIYKKSKNNEMINIIQTFIDKI